jgi:hypothetical protein
MENKTGRGFERASRISHSHIINDEQVREYLGNCTIPVDAKDVDLDPSLIHDIVYPSCNSIEHIIAVDGEKTIIPVKKDFPSSLITFFQFGSLLIKNSDLEEMKQKPFVSPTDIRKLKDIKREKLVIPTKNVSLKNGTDLKTSVRKAIQEFFKKNHSGSTSMLQTLYWFLFELYDYTSTIKEYQLSHCPHCGTEKIKLEKDKMNLGKYSWECTHPKCKKEILITDVFRLFEKVDNETGAEGILSYLNSLIESFLLIHTIKSLLEIEEGLVDRFLFVKDGPLSFSGETANMHKPMQSMLNFLTKSNRVNLVGLENTGPFVDHAKQIRDKLRPGQLLLLSNRHIYSYILPGSAETSSYASTSYYSGKMIYKSQDERLYVLTVPVEDHNTYYDKPELNDLKNIAEILMNIDRLKCDIYENALMPIALANKLVALTNHPSSNILEKFAKKTMAK